LWVCSALAGYVGWSCCRQVWKVERELRCGGKDTVQEEYLITSLGQEEAHATRLLKLRGEHSPIEKRLH